MPRPTPVQLGVVPGVAPGHEFLNRQEVQAAKVHRDRIKGISSLSGFPAEAIVLSGGYEDDWDAGGTILYTGEGGNSQGTQVADQTLTGGNLALHRSFEQQTPVRVIRQIRPAKTRSSWYYEYAGLYSVASCSYERGRSGFMIWRFLLEQLSENAQLVPLTSQVQESAVVYQPAPRITTSVSRLVRDTSLMQRVKQLYNFHCQVCLQRLANQIRPYAEAAHLQPLGAPHHGPDTLDNLLCLCPNHHVLLDMGAWSLDDSFKLQAARPAGYLTGSSKPPPENGMGALPSTLHLSSLLMYSPDDAQRYADQHTSPESPLLARLNRETHVQVLHARMLSGHAQGRLLSMLSHMVRPHRILELGTFTGYSALCLAEGLRAGGHLHTVEQNPELAGRIRRYVHEAGLDDRITLHVGLAGHVVPLLAETWDLVFIDADKINNDAYYELVLPQVRPGGFLLIDNVLWNGKVLDGYPVKPSDKDTHAVRAFNAKVQADERVENVLLPLRDGLLLVRKH